MADFDFSTLIEDGTDQFKLPPGRVIWQDLFVPKVVTDYNTKQPIINPKTGNPKTEYSVTLAFDKDALVELDAAVSAAIGRLMKQPKWPAYTCLRGGKKEQDFLAEGMGVEEIKTFTKGLKYPKEHDLEKNPHLAGMVTLTAKTAESHPPAVVGPAGPTDRMGLNRKEEIYRGAYGIALVYLRYNTTQKRLTYRLKAFQKVKDGDPLGGSVANIQMFESFQQDISEGSLAGEDASDGEI